MAKARGDFTDILLRKQVLSTEQLQEAASLSQQTAAKLQDCLVRLGYASLEQVMAAVAEYHGLQFINLAETPTPHQDQRRSDDR